VAVLGLALGLSLSGPAVADHHESGESDGDAGVFQIDPVHSSVGFKVRHFVSNVGGNFRKFSGTISVNPDDLAATKVEAEIDAGSIDTDNDDRDAHLKSDDFFDVENHPSITFKSTGVKVVDKTHLQITGDLTMRGVTKPVTLDAELLGIAPGMRGATLLGAEAVGTVNRKDFGISWNRTMDAGGVVLGEDVEMILLIEAKIPPKKAAAN
jgi:polyisoprenoid-binding protein YceI